jgi:hypothetical protein
MTGKIVIATGKKNVDYMDDSLMGMQDVEYHKHFEKNKPGGNNTSNYVKKFISKFLVKVSTVTSTGKFEAQQWWFIEDL